jgi:hypothetical protein
VITRRMFVGAIAAGSMARGHLVLEAVAAESMPHRLIVSGVSRAPFFEVRDYGDAEISGILNRHGIRTVLRDHGRFLFAFETLAERERAWREVSADAEWVGATVREISVYRSV